MPKFAPINIPFHRRIETLAVWITTALFFIFLAIFIFCLFNSWTYPFLILYIFYMSIDNSPERGGRRVEWVRRLTFWKYVRDFFPVQIVKLADLHPTGNYLFGYHPHGIISTGMWVSICTEACGFSELYPGIKVHPLTLTQNFKIPFWRDFLLCFGLCSVSRKSCDYLLKSVPGNSALIVPGGAREALDSHPGTSRLTLNKRKGFIKVALSNGASLVPIFSFGENDIFLQVDNSEGTYVRKWQQFFLQYVGIAPCMPYGRGIFQYDFGFLPRRHPINVVIGKPIKCPKLTQSEMVDAIVEEYHQKYVDGLAEIYNEYKDKYAKDRKEDLKIIR